MCGGVAVQALEMSSVDTIIVWENLSVNRLLVKNSSTGEERVLHLTPEQEQNDSHFRDAATGRCTAHVSPSPPFPSSPLPSRVCSLRLLPFLALAVVPARPSTSTSTLTLTCPIQSNPFACLVLYCLVLSASRHVRPPCVCVYECI